MRNSYITVFYEGIKSKIFFYILIGLYISKKRNSFVQCIKILSFVFIHLLALKVTL
jgi:hypothetical protein